MKVPEAVPPQIRVVNPATLRRRQDGDEPEGRAGGEKVQAPLKYASEGGVTTAGPSEGDDRPERRVAVLICHGMGQQVPFENLDMIATALAGEDGAQAATDHPRDSRKPQERADKVGFVRIGEQWLPRVELELSPRGGKKTEVHVYEAYWAPLMEGRVSALDVTRFLLDAGVRGLQYGLRWSFRRRVFGEDHSFRLGLLTPFLLIIAFAVVLSALSLYFALGLVMAAQILLAVAPTVVGTSVEHFSATVLAHLFTSPLAISLVILPLVALTWASRVVAAPFHLLRVYVGGSLFDRVAGLAGWALGFVALIALALEAVTMWGGKTVSRILDEILVSAGTRPVDLLGNVEPLTYGAALVGTAGLLVVAALAYARWYGVRRGIGILSGFAAVGLIAWIMHSVWSLGQGIIFSGASATEYPETIQEKVFTAVFLFSSVILCYRLRALYIQYLGDVAAYLSSNKLNEFYEVRERIKKISYDVGCAIYAAERSPGKPEYDEVVVAGHSLGSVVAYDTLNAVLNEDRAREESARMGASERTRMFITFGSPLDKVAFFFGTQVENAPYREALATAVQPLIEPDGVRVGGGEAQETHGRTIPWVNIHSGLDPVSGSVEFYDPPRKTVQKHFPVDNQVDLEALLFGQAHVTYWKNSLLRERLYEAVTTPRPSPPKDGSRVPASQPAMAGNAGG